MVCAGLIAAFTLRFLYKNQNKKRAAQIANGITLSREEVSQKITVLL